MSAWGHAIFISPRYNASMGTNYYSVRREVAEREDFHGESLSQLSVGEDVLHIGKSSGGWCFSLHVIPELGINSLRDWVVVFIDPERVMFNEYYERVGLEEIMGVITARSWRDRPPWDEKQLARNYAEQGPNNLVRHRIGHHCIGHGEGTWDYITGHFS